VDESVQGGFGGGVVWANEPAGEGGRGGGEDYPARGSGEVREGELGEEDGGAWCVRSEKGKLIDE
jgi:hypothetical protein